MTNPSLENRLEAVERAVNRRKEFEELPEVVFNNITKEALPEEEWELLHDSTVRKQGEQKLIQ